MPPLRGSTYSGFDTPIERQRRSILQPGVDCEAIYPRTTIAQPILNPEGVASIPNVSFVVRNAVAFELRRGALVLLLSPPRGEGLGMRGLTKGWPGAM